MKVDEYENFIDRFQDKIKDSIFPDQYNNVKMFITSIVRSLDYGSKINRDNFNKLIKYGMYHTLTTYYLYELKRPEVVDEITSSIIAKDKALDIKNKKVEEPKQEMSKIKPIKDEPEYNTNGSYSRVKQILDTYKEYGILEPTIDTRTVSSRIVDDLKKSGHSEERIASGKSDYNVFYIIRNSNCGVSYSKNFISFRKETFNYLSDIGVLHYISSESYNACLEKATKMAVVFRINGIEAKDFKEETTYKFVENYMTRENLKARSIEESRKEKATLSNTVQDVKNIQSRIKAVPKEKKIDAAVIATRIFVALVILKIVQTLGNYIYDNALEKKMERQRENRPDKPKYEYATKGLSSDGYYAIDELLHGRYNPETNEYEIGSDYVAKL